MLNVHDPLHDTIFFEKEIWFYIFGSMILLYIIAAIYNRIKRPRKEIKNVKAKVLSITKARVQTTHRNAGFDGLMSGSAIPAARFDVTFIDENNGEAFIFAISESLSEKFTVGEVGILCFNGDEFISFGEELERNKSEQIYFMKKRIVPVTICAVFLISFGIWTFNYFFQTEDKQESIVIEDISDRPLTVYMSAHMAAMDEVIASSMYSLGDFTGLMERWGNSSHMYYGAVENYKKSTGREVEIEYFNTSEEMLQKAYDEWKDGVGPDVIIGDYSNGGCLIYPYISEGMFEDMMPYFENDELYSSGEYIEQVLAGGMVGDLQLVFPLTFNMNMLFTTEERIREHEIWLSDEMTYDEMLDLFRNEWNAMRAKDEYLMAQLTGFNRNRNPILLFQSASGIEIVDYETGEIQLSMDDFADWATLYESYICDEYQMDRNELKEYVAQNPDVYIPVRESKSYILETLSNGESVSDVFDLTKEDIFCWANGGSVTGPYIPFAANACYYESRLTDNEETFVPIAIPIKQNSNENAAEITSFGVIVSGSLKTEEAYEFIKALADYEHFMYFDLSVNRQVIMDTLDKLNNTNYSLNTAVALLPAQEAEEVDNPTNEIVGSGDNDWYDQEDYLVRALSEETKEYLLNMVEDIGVANLVEGKLDAIVIEEIGKYIWGDVDTVEEAYMNTMQRLVGIGYIYYK